MPEIAHLAAVVEANTADAERNLERFGQRFDQAGKTAVEAGGKIERTGKQVERTGKGLDSAGRSSQKFRGELRSIASGAAGATSAVGTLLNKLSGLSSGMAKFRGNASQGFLSSLGIQRGDGLASLMGGGAGSLLKSGAGALLGQLTDAQERGLAFNDLIERSKIAMTSFLGTEEQAIAHMRELVEFGAKTPFKVQDLIPYSQGLQAVGVDAKEVKTILTGLGEAASASGNFEGMSNAVRAVQQMLSKGKITAEELRGQLAEAIPGAQGYLARGLGISEAKLAEAMEKGSLDAVASIKLMIDQMTRERGGMMARTQASTVAGLLSTKEDAEDLLFAQGIRGGDPFGAVGGAYAQKMNLISRRTENLQGPEAKNIAGKVGKSAETFYWAENQLEENAFKSATGRDELIQFFKDPGAAARNFTQTLTSSLESGATTISTSAASVAGGIVNTINQRLGINSPSTIAIEQGKFYGQGLVIGLSDPSNIAAVTGAVDALISPILNQTRGPQRSRRDPETRRAENEELLKDPRVQAMMDAIGVGEGTFNRRTGERSFFKWFGNAPLNPSEEHPGLSPVRFFNKQKGRMDKSSAAGFGQFLRGTWQGAEQDIGDLDFNNPLDQMLAFVEKMRDRNMVAPLLRGDTRTAMARGAPEWASLPGSPYQQPTVSQSTVIDTFNARLGVYQDGGEAPTQDFNRSIDASAQAAQAHAEALRRTAAEVEQAGSAYFSSIARSQNAFRNRPSMLGADGTRGATGRTIDDPVTVIGGTTTALQKLEITTDSAIAGLEYLTKKPLIDAGVELAKLGQSANVASGLLSEQERERLRRAALGGGAKEASDQLQRQLEGFAGNAADIITGGFRDGWAGVGDGFRSLLAEMTSELLRSQLLKSLRGLFRIEGNAAGSQEGPGEQQGGGLLGSLIDKIFNRTSSQTARQLPDGQPAQQRQPDPTPTAITQAGREAVTAVTGAGEAQAGAVSRTGDATTKTLAGVGQGIVGQMATIAATIAAGNGRGSFLSGLFQAAAAGFVSGFIGAQGASGGGTGGSAGGHLPGGTLGGGAGSASTYFGATAGQGAWSGISAPPIFVPPRSLGGSIGEAHTSIETGDFILRQATTARLPPSLRAALGEMIQGPGSGTSDSITGVDGSGRPTAVVSNGELRIPRAVAELIGGSQLNYLNQTGQWLRDGASAAGGASRSPLAAAFSPRMKLALGGAVVGDGAAALPLTRRAGGGVIDASLLARPRPSGGALSSGGDSARLESGSRAAQHYHLTQEIYTNNPTEFRRTARQNARAALGALRLESQRSS